MPMLHGMTRSWLRRTLTSVLGLIFAASMSASAVQATEMAASMTLALAAGPAAHGGECPDCDHGNRDMKTMDCRVAVCGAPGLATLGTQSAVAVQAVGHDVPVSVQSSLAGWAYPPDPHPPRFRTLG